ncbi:MAG: Rrf2 family transcriptional regulator [Spirochaetaceae bacterium]|jgi:Rrf2 family protein|nr:Rrf2 family transcriptional regulator [Spirochaetaceae bacterium]
MLITKESDYAVRIIRELSRGGRETVQTICRNERIPQPYGYKILKKLEKKGLVTSFRGAKGGYSLLGNPEKMTLFDVFTAVDGNLLLTECMGPKRECPMNSEGRCRVHGEFSRLQELLLQGLKERPLTEIL